MSTAALYRLLALIALWKGVEISALSDAGRALPMLVSGGLLLLRPPFGAAALALSSLLVVLAPSAFGQSSTNHLTLVFWVALTCAIFTEDDQQRQLLRWSLIAMYGFATLAKIWPDWLSGAALVDRTLIGQVLPLPLVVAAAWATLVVEAVLCLAAVRRWRLALPLAIALHGSFLVATTAEPWRIGRLAIFGGLTVAVWLRVLGPAGPRSLAGRGAGTHVRRGGDALDHQRGQTLGELIDRFAGR